MKKIASVNNSFIKELRKLRLKKYRDQAEKFLIEGYHLVSEAASSGLLETVLICDEKDEIRGIENVLVTEEIIGKLAQSQAPQKIIGVCRFLPRGPLAGKRFLLLDGISDPGNMGTLIRSALGFGVDCVIASPDSVDIYNDKVLRATQGAIFKIKILKEELTGVIARLKADGVIVYGALPKGGVPLRDLSRAEKHALVLGNESRGIRDDIAILCDENITIETQTRLESLNVSVAGSVIMYFLSQKKNH
ncbi:MAG: RNA methyltransferase [Bacilli bacterium]|jgi:TrmH family RNA methyltransferase